MKRLDGDSLGTSLDDRSHSTQAVNNHSPDSTVSTVSPPTARKRHSGQAALSARAVSLRDVAQAAQVSVATVSMVLNNNPRISRATHARVQRVMDKLGYQPNRLAQSLSSKYTNVLAILMPDLRNAFADAYFGEVISGICERAHSLGYKVMLEHAKPAFIHARKHLEIIDRRYVDGVLALGTDDTQTWLADFEPGVYPALIVDNHIQNRPNLDFVACDHASGARQLLSYLLQLGHRKIGLITAGTHIASHELVRDTVRERLQTAGVEFDESWMADGMFTEEGGANAALELVNHHPDLTALFCTNDKMALGAMHQLRRLRIEVPRQVSVVGFDDLRHAAFVNPALTTVHLPLHQVGAIAAERLIERIRGRSEPVKELLGTHLVVRDSTGIARDASHLLSEGAD
jgi:LacI family transcriptional regulator